jgi:hypothetical protein
MGSMRRIVLVVAVLTVGSIAWGNKIAKEQEKWVPQYKKQANVPVPENMLINTDPEPDLSKGFVDLYNGKNLDGWIPRGGNSEFVASGEAIVGTVVKDSPSTYLSTIKDDYTDFVFTCEMKWEIDNNTGIMFRGLSKEEKGQEIVYGPQAEMEGFEKDRCWSGGIYGQDCGGWYYPLWLEAHTEVRKALRKDDWNRITIMARGQTVKTWLNGLPAAHWENDQYLKGFFSLQIHKGKDGTVLFRNIKVKELK